MKRLLVIRHGETIDNAAKRIQGQYHGELSPTGWEQARALGERLKGEKIDAIYSSDLHRSRCTTEALARHHSCPVHYRPELRERAFGIFERGSIDDYLSAFAASGTSLDQFRPEGGESLVELFERVDGCLRSIADAHPGETVVISAHFSVNKCVIFSLLGKPLAEWKEIPQSNTCVNTFEFSAPLRVERYELNCTRHLVQQ